MRADHKTCECLEGTSLGWSMLCDTRVQDSLKPHGLPFTCKRFENTIPSCFSQKILRLRSRGALEYAIPDGDMDARESIYLHCHDLVKMIACNFLEAHGKQLIADAQKSAFEANRISATEVSCEPTSTARFKFDDISPQWASRTRIRRSRRF